MTAEVKSRAPRPLQGFRFLDQSWPTHDFVVFWGKELNIKNSMIILDLELHLLDILEHDYSGFRTTPLRYLRAWLFWI